MEFVQQNINMQKTKLLNLINNLNSTLLIEQEIFINNEIKKECDTLSTFLKEKQKYILNQIGINNNINPFLMPHPNTMMNVPQMNINPIQISQVQLFNKDQNNFENENKNNIIDLHFNQSNATGKTFVVHCVTNERICDAIEKYRKKANDFNDNYFLFNSIDLNGSTSSIKEKGLRDKCKITVFKKGELKAGKNRIHISNY